MTLTTRPIRRLNPIRGEQLVIINDRELLAEYKYWPPSGEGETDTLEVVGVFDKSGDEVMFYGGLYEECERQIRASK